MRRLRFQSFMDVVALPTGFLVVDLHVERQREFAFRKHRIKIGGQHLEDMFAGLLSRGEVAAFAEAQYHVEKAEMRTPVGDGGVFASDSADADAPERENPGFDRGL